MRRNTAVHEEPGCLFFSDLYALRIEEMRRRRRGANNTGKRVVTVSNIAAVIRIVPKRSLAIVGEKPDRSRINALCDNCQSGLEVGR